MTFRDDKYLYHVEFKENEIPYGQDFSWSKGIPKDVLFEVRTFNDTEVTLTGYGYGVLHTKPYDDKAYGSGHLFVMLKHLNKAFKNKIAKKVKLPPGYFEKPNPKICKCCGREIKDEK
jgi:hypothetical protein